MEVPFYLFYLCTVWGIQTNNYPCGKITMTTHKGCGTVLLVFPVPHYICVHLPLVHATTYNLHHVFNIKKHMYSKDNNKIKYLEHNYLLFVWLF